MNILKFKKIGKDKYKVYLDNNTNINLYEDVIINNNLLISKCIPENMLENIIKENAKYDLYFSAVNYISIKMRSKSEMINYLSKKCDDEKEVNNVIDRLIKNGLINDFNYSKAYVNDQMLLSTSGPNKIKQGLIKSGIDNEIVEEVISEIDDILVREKLSNLIEKQIRIKKSGTGSSKMLKIKLLNYFNNLGYDKMMILSELDNYNIKSDITKLKKEYDKLIMKYQKKYSGNDLNLFVRNKLYQKGYSIEEINKIKED